MGKIKYIPKPRNAEINHNVSREHPLLTLLEVLFGVIALIGGIFISIWVLVTAIIWYDPILANNALAKLTPQIKNYNSDSEEEKLLHERLSSIYQKMRPHLDEHNQEYKISVITNSTPNAFANPDGTIVFHTETGKMLSNEIELAMILAHEIGHYQHRHHLERAGTSLATIITSLIISSSDLSASSSINNVLQLLLFSYTKNQEKEADLYALELVYKTYGNVEGVTNFFEILSKDENNWLSSDLLNTHPGSRKRVEYIKEKAKELGYTSR